MSANLWLLAGPILRRASRTGVWVWLAFTEPTEVRIRVLDGYAMLSPRFLEVEMGAGTAGTVALGRHLHVAMVELKPHSDGFAVDAVLTYEVSAKRASSVGFEVLEIPRIALPPFKLPTFVLRDNYPIRILHASCRKAHGEGSDMLAEIERLLVANAVRFRGATRPDAIRHAQERPSALYLTGDQIYADDVSKKMDPHIREWGEWLIQRKERVVAPDYSGPLRDMGPRAKTMPALTSEAKDHHLVGFGEFAAMYASCWSPDFLPSHPHLSREVRLRVRCVLANIPTYMIFDDHEVTDDWNLSKRWTEKVANDALARRMVLNAVAAYWVFQGWGNEPERGSAKVLADLADGLEDNRQGQPAKLDAILRNLRHDYVSPGFPKVVVIDARMHRDLKPSHDQSPRKPAALLDAQSLERLGAAMRTVKATQPMIVVAPAPVVGPDLREIGARLKSRMGDGPAAGDDESWDANPLGAIAFKSMLARHMRGEACIFLSGDVHFGSIYTEYFDSQKIPSGFFVQFTSSSLKNEPAGGDAFAYGAMTLRENDLLNIKQKVLLYTTRQDRLEGSLRGLELSALDKQRFAKRDVIDVSEERINELGIVAEPDHRRERVLLLPLLGAANFGQLDLDVPAKARLTLHYLKEGQLVPTAPKTIDLTKTKRPWQFKRPEVEVLEKEPPKDEGGIWLEPGLLRGRVLFADFGVNRTELRSQFKSPLDALAVLLLQPGATCTIIGRASQTGHEGNNMALSQNRALSVLHYLQQTVPSGRIKDMEGYGDKRPLKNAPGVEADVNRSVVVNYAVPYIPPVRQLREDTEKFTDWGIKLWSATTIQQFFSGEPLALPVKLLLGTLRATMTGETRGVICGTAGLELSLGVSSLAQIFITKKPASKWFEKVLNIMEKVSGDPNLKMPWESDWRPWDAFSTTRPCSFRDFQYAHFMITGGGLTLGAGWTKEALSFFDMPIEGDIDIGGMEVGLAGLELSKSHGFMFLPSLLTV